ncbi:hypothetical protein ES332_A10G286600v1 [Gossypium tomentosum]|uniref:Uncharacterized protein n=1 Tax=Gossypium tomentosum TaxID=34277 RepID=A0A5D2NYT4_GOSTO|nr:hypothetical protein ES332_A10G286600v1 [Gossypium tomentosum]
MNTNNSGMANHKLTNFSFLMAVLLALFNLKFQPQPNIESPFETQSVIMEIFVICILVFAITLCTPYFPEVIDDINLLAGSFAAVLLTFTLFPGLGWVILFIWVIFFVKQTYRAIRKFCQLYRGMSSTSDLFNRVLFGRRHAHHNEESNGTTTNNNWHAGLAFAVGVFLALMPVKYQSMAPFETYNALMLMVIIVTLVYAAAWQIEYHLQSSNNNSSIHRIIVTKISLLSGSLAAVVLVLVIVPAIGWFVLLVWTLFLMKQIYEACQMLHRLYQSISLVSYVFNEVVGPRGHLSQGRNGLVA